MQHIMDDTATTADATATTAATADFMPCSMVTCSVHGAVDDKATDAVTSTQLVQWADIMHADDKAGPTMAAENKGASPTTFLGPALALPLRSDRWADIMGAEEAGEEALEPTSGVLYEKPGASSAAGTMAPVGAAVVAAAAMGASLTPHCGPGFPPAPRLGAIHKSKCALPPDPPLTPQVMPGAVAAAVQPVALAVAATAVAATCCPRKPQGMGATSSSDTADGTRFKSSGGRNDTAPRQLSTTSPRGQWGPPIQNDVYPGSPPQPPEGTPKPP